MSLPIRVRLTAWFGVLLTTIVCSLGTFLVLQLRTDLRQAIDDSATAGSETIVSAFADDGPEIDDEEAADAVDDAEDFADAAGASLPPGSRAQVLGDQAEVLLSHGRLAEVAPLLGGAAAAEVSRVGRASRFTAPIVSGGQRYRILATPFEDRGADRVLVVAVSLQPVEDAVRRVLVLLLVAGPAALAATMVAAYWLARKALRPVEQMTSDAQEIGTAQLNERVAEPGGHDEIWRLAVTLNAMLARIEHGVMDKQRLIADASHELRTPLAVMRAEFDVSLRGDELSAAGREVIESAREEVDRVSRTVDNLLALAAADEGRLELLTVRVELRAVVEKAVAPLRLLAAAKQVALTVDGHHHEVQADPQRLGLALTNLVENAIKFTPPGEAVRVSVWRRGDEIGVTVSDGGPGVSALDQEHLFDRYYRADSARAQALGGSGLGLAIAREVAVSHGGRIWVESLPGGGSAFSLALPAWRTLVSTDEHRRPVPDDVAQLGHLTPNT